MADFTLAYKKTMGHEVGYVDDPDDTGGETYDGISRKYNPSWPGWALIDQYKPNFSKEIKAKLEALKKIFYKEKYWGINHLDDFESQEIAEELFDTGVNMGVVRAAQFLQESLNYLNKNGSLYSDLLVDGDIGSKTKSVLDIIMRRKDDALLLKILNVLQARQYLEYMKKDPTQEKFIRGWFNRVFI